MNTRQKIYTIIFESDTKAGRLFDIILLWAILISVFITMLDSVPKLHLNLLKEFAGVEWFFTLLFTVEYLVRIIVSPKPKKYIFSFWGFIDLMAIVPTYISLLVYGYQYLLVVRIVRMLRVFRILKMVRFNREATTLLRALRASSYKIGIFFMTVIAIVIVLGALMYVVEGPENGFTSIFQSIYWAIITITTVGYGDIVPQTVAGKMISSLSMIIGYAIIAVPTGIVTVEMSRSEKFRIACPQCGFQNSESANFCTNCGSKMNPEP